MVNTLLSEATPVAILCTSGLLKVFFPKKIIKSTFNFFFLSKEPNVRTRNAALELLSSLADTAKCNGDDNGKDECKSMIQLK